MCKHTIPTIETDRLILRPLTVDDAEEAFGWTGDERVAKYMLWSTHHDTSVTREWLDSLEYNDKEYVWGFVRKSDGKLIGSGSIRYRTDEQRWSFGYNIRYGVQSCGATYYEYHRDYPRNDGLRPQRARGEAFCRGTRR